MVLLTASLLIRPADGACYRAGVQTSRGVWRGGCRASADLAGEVRGVPEDDTERLQPALQILRLGIYSDIPGTEGINDGMSRCSLMSLDYVL